MVRTGKDSVVSGAEWIANFTDVLIEGLRARGCTGEEIHSLVTRKGRPAMDKIADSVAELIRATKITFQLTKIADGRTTEELVRDGKYDYAHPGIPSLNFPVRPRQGTAEIVLLEFEHDVTSEEAISEAEKLGLVRPTCGDALYFGIEHPEVQRERPVVFLHELWLGVGGSPSVLYLWGDAGRRGLSLDWFGGRWVRRFRFAFVRK